MNGRFVNIRPEFGEATPSIDTLYSPATVPGLASQPGFLQLERGCAFDLRSHPITSS